MYGSITVTDASGAEIAPRSGTRATATRYALPPAALQRFDHRPVGRHGDALRRGSHARRRRKLRPRHIERARELHRRSGVRHRTLVVRRSLLSAGRAGHRRRRHGALPARREKRAAHVLPSEQRLAAKRRGRPRAVLLQPIHRLQLTVVQGNLAPDARGCGK